MLKMWMVSPKYMCNTHIQEEHDNIHALAALVDAGVSFTIDVIKNSELQHLNARHDSLVIDMEARGIEHTSPLQACPVSPHLDGEIDLVDSAMELMASCSDCCAKFAEHKDVLDGFNMLDMLAIYQRAHKAMEAWEKNNG